ncbi:DUF3854 domain-containing protein [Microcoleus sp. herbarium5]|uniref:DUF3854 domain-containing protein n=1 Tax=Microcoleus sp. herbarium5 TaxID=3055434 RepID=UPI002FD6238A
MDNVPSISQTVAVTRNKSLLNAAVRHLDEWVLESGVSASIATRSIVSPTDRVEIAKAIGWKSYPDCNPLGWLVRGVDLKTMQPQEFCQFKPDSEILLDGEKTKYLTPSKKKGLEYDAIALPHPDPEYWRRVVDDPSIPVDIDEGAKKSGCGITCGFPSLALPGVAMWQIKGELVNNLDALAVPGRTIRIRFDMDLLFKKGVLLELKKLAKVLEDRGCTVLVAMWDKELGLKIDDVKVNHGSEMVKKIMAEAQPYAQWLKNLENQINNTLESPDKSDTSSKTRSKKTPTPREIAAQLAEEYRPHWKYYEEQQTWRGWTGKCWEKIKPGPFKSLIVTTLDAKGINYSGIEYINNVIEMLKCYLREVYWQTWDKSRYVNFNNCVLDGDTLETLPPSPGMGFTSFLPFDYKPLEGDLSDPLEALRVNCPNTHKFFRTAMLNDERKMFKLLAIVNAVLKYRFFDLQMFVHCVGAPGSGKGKYARYLQKMVGKDNTTSGQLEKLSDGSTKASCIDKQAVIFPDERKPVGIDSILSLTGGDVISYRELYQPAASAHFYGSLVICSNKPIFIGDTTGLERRLCLVGFDNPIATEKRDHSLEAELDAEIPACIVIALSLPDIAITQTIRGVGANQITEFKRKEWEMKIETSSVAAFFDSELVLDPTATTRVGKIYDAYTHFCEEGGLSKFSIVKLPRLLADLLTDENLPFTRHQGSQAYFEGIRMREKSDTYPTHSEVLSAVEGVDKGVAGSLQGVTEGVEPLPDIPLRELRELEPKVSTGNKNEENYLPDEEERDRETQETENFSPSTPSTPSNPVPVTIQTPSPTPSQVPSSASPTPSTSKSDMQTVAKRQRAKRMADEYRKAKASGDTERMEKIRKFIESTDGLPLRGFFKRALNGTSPTSQSEPKPSHIFEIGDRVVVKDVGGLYHGARGVIVDTHSYSYHMGLLVKFDKPVSFCEQFEFIAGDLMYLPEK